MKKLFTSFVAAGTIGSFAACHKKDKKATATKETKTETKKSTTATSSKTVVKGKVQKGTFKIGVTGKDLTKPGEGKELLSVVTEYSQDVKNPSLTGPEYFNLPSGLFLKRSSSKWETNTGDLNFDKDFNDDGEKANGHMQLSDKTKLASNNLDALFIAVTDEQQNSSDVYKAIVEKKEFKETQLFLVGEKAKAQSGASSKTFAGGKVSTASFNKYAAAYVAGFQAAVGAIKYSSSEDEYEETTVSFLIGATSESEDKKKAFAFRRGVEAAAAHSAYSKYLKVKFVSKTEDSSKSSKKLYREISEWKARDDGKSKLYEFSSSESFTDADRRIVYIAGSTAKDWIGETKKQNLTKDGLNTFFKDDDFGLIGALYNYRQASASGEESSKLTGKTFTRGVWIVLDKAYGLEWNKGTDWSHAQEEKSESASNEAIDSKDDAGVISNAHNLTQVYEGLDGDAPSNHQIGLTLERHSIKFYGAIGGESAGTEHYAKVALKGLYMGGPNYMIGKHTVFGAPLDLSKLTKTQFSQDKDAQNPWTWKSSKDTTGKVKDRFKKSLGYATSLEVTEAELTKSSPWLK